MMLFMIILLEWLTGLGVLAISGFRLRRSLIFPLSLLTGVFVHNVAFFLCDIVGFGLGQVTLLSSAVLCAVAAHAIPAKTKEFYDGLVRRPAMTLRMHDVVVLAIGCTLGYYVIWAAWFWPVTPFDAMAGIDLVARQAVQESTIANRVFSDPALHGQLSNQPFYAPFAMLLQVEYRLMQFMYGQVWVAIVAVAFFWFMWAALRQFCNPFIANVLWLLLILTPELLGYTYLLQTDFLNAAYFSMGVVLLALHIRDTSSVALGAIALAFAAACWARSETILIVVLGCAACLPIAMKALGGRSALRIVSWICGASVATFALWSVLYVQFFLPVQPDLVREVQVFGFDRLVDVTVETFTNVTSNVDLWGVVFAGFFGLLIINLVVTRSLGEYTVFAWIVVTYFSLLIIGTMFSSAIVEQTLRRGIFKIIPLLMMFIAALPLTQRWGKSISRWEVQV